MSLSWSCFAPVALAAAAVSCATCVVGVYGFLILREAVLNFFCFGAQNGRMLGDGAQRLGEGHVDCVIAETQCFECQAMLGATVGKLRQILSGGERRLIDHRLRLLHSERRENGADRDVGLLGAVQPEGRDRKKQHEHNGCNLRSLGHVSSISRVGMTF